MYSYPISVLVQWHNTPSCCCCECSIISWDIVRSVLAWRLVGCVVNNIILTLMAVIIMVVRIMEVIKMVVIIMVWLKVLDISTKLCDH